MFSALLFIFFCFFGILAAIFYLLKKQDQAWQTLREEHAQLRVLLRALESRLEYLAAVTLDPEQARRAEARAASEAGEDERQARMSARPGGRSGTDPLLRLSFEDPGSPASHGSEAGHDPALEIRFAPGEEADRR